MATQHPGTQDEPKLLVLRLLHDAAHARIKSLLVLFFRKELLPSSPKISG
jgi:hypothetical protein